MSIKCDNLKHIAHLDANGYMFNGSLYRVLGASPSQQKKAVKFYFKVTEEVPDEKVAFFKMDKVSGYVYTRGLFTRKLTGKDITKSNTRWANYLTGMKTLAHIDLNKDYIMIVKGSIDGACDVTEETNKDMKAAGIEIENNINDGGIYFNPALVQEIGSNVGVNLTHEDALRVALQVRITHITAKCMSRCMEEEQLKQIAMFGNAVPYGNTNGRLLLVADTDGAKLLNNTDLENGSAVLDVRVMAQAKMSQPKTSGQHAIKYMAVDPEATVKFFEQTTKENLAMYVMDQVEENNSNLNNLVKALGEEAFSNKALFESIIKDSFTYIQAAIAKCKLSIPAVYSHMMFDATYALTNGLLAGVLRVTENGFVEAYSADVCRLYAEEIKEIEDKVIAGILTEEQGDAELFKILSGTVIKYPSAGTKEYELIVYQTERQIERSIKEQVAELELDNEEAEAMAENLQAYFNNTPFGTTVYAPVNAMKNKLAGADCDFDATMCDMSDLKWILINNRLEQQKEMPGFMGNCTYISYKDIDRTNLNKTEEIVDTLGNTDDMEW